MNNLCYTMTNKSLGAPFDRLVYLVNTTIGGYIDSSYKRYIEGLSNKDFGASVGGESCVCITLSDRELSFQIKLYRACSRV